MRKEIGDIQTRLYALDALCFKEPAKQKIIYEVFTLLLKVDDVPRPEGISPLLEHATVKELARAMHDPANEVCKRYARKDKRLNALKIIQWFTHLAIEKLETGK
jgi:hypothetical protein